MQVIRWDGKPVKKPGWYSGIPLEKYHGPRICDGPSVSSTDLRTCWAKSPAHMQLSWAENPKREERTVTRPMVLGGAAHHVLLGEDGFRTKYVCQPSHYRDKVTASTKPWHNGAGYCRRWQAEQREKGRQVVTNDELQSIIAMAESLKLLPVVNDGLLRGHVELSGFAKDVTGLWLKVRPDVVPTDDGAFCDLKTAAEVTTPALQSAIRSRGYHMQGALIWEVSELLNHPFEDFILLFIESAAPFCARAVPLPKDDLSRGRLQNRAMLRKVRACIDIGIWPGPGEEEEFRELPLSHDERSRIDHRLKREGLA